jgi:NADH-quinone oxidoreductase subunit G
MEAMAGELPVFAPVPEVAPRSGFRIVEQRIPREPHRYSGRTAMLSNINVHEPKPPEDPDTPLNFSMEGYEGKPPAGLIPRYWAPGWNSVQALNKFQDEVAGPLMGGDPGRRLIENQEVTSPGYFQNPPNAFDRREGEWLIVPLYHIFGSEELSILTPGIAELAPEPYLALNAEDAAQLGVQPGENIVLSLEQTAIDLPAKIIPSLPGGCVGYPAGLPGLPRFMIPTWGRLMKNTDQV